MPQLPTVPPAVPAAADLAQLEQVLEHFERLEAQFQLVREGLTHSHRLTTLGTLTSIIAHEYNNILTPILSYGQLALASPDDQPLMRKAVEKAIAGAERAARLSSSILGFAHDHDGETTASVPTVVSEAVACLAREPQKDGIQLTVDVPAVEVAMAPLALQQVLVNLLLNARKAMRRKGGQLTISGRREGVNIVLSVSDTGPGIPAEVAGRLFEPFVTHRIGGDEDPSAPRGTGLGLCICRDLLRAAGGDISAHSVPGQGATFTLRLPIAGDGVETT